MACHLVTNLVRRRSIASIALAEAKARFSALVERAEAGETIEITKRGRTVAKLVPTEPPRESFDWAALHAFIAEQEPQEDSGVFVRRMRNEYRY